MARRAKKQNPRPNATRTSVPQGSRGGQSGHWTLPLGTLIGGFGVSLAMIPGGANPFGTAKALVLAMSAALVLTGLALDRAALSSAWRLVAGSKLAWAVCSLLGVALLATLTAVDMRQALLGGHPDYRGLVSMFAYSVIGLGALAIWSAKEGPRLIGRAAIVALAVADSYALLQRAGIFASEWRGVLRVSSLLGNPSNFGVFLLIVVPLAVWAAVTDTARWRNVAIAAVGAAVPNLIWTQSRGAWVAVVIALVVVGALAAQARRLPRVTRPVSIAAGAAVLLAIAAIALTPGFSARAASVLDVESNTASWRLVTWISSAEMALARPFLGYGPDNFRYAYPAFQEPGQMSGRWGYQVVESAHNLGLDTLTSFGIAGLLALLAIAALASVNIWNAVRDQASASRALALSAALVGAAVSLQFHYVTMDSGALLAVVVAGVISLESREPTRDASSAESRARLGLVAGAAAYSLLALSFVGVIIADGYVVRAHALAGEGAPWTQVSAPLQNARRWAPFEPQVMRAEGVAATKVLEKRFDAAAYDDGLAALDAAREARPHDAILAVERANLSLAAGIASKDRGLVERAISGFEEAAGMDPNTGVALAGQASGLLALGQVEEAVRLFERSLQLSPRYVTAWANVSRGYDILGRAEDAEKAKRRAERYR